MKAVQIFLGVLLFVSLHAEAQFGRSLVQRRGYVQDEVIIRLAGSYNLDQARRALDPNVYELKEILSPTLNLFLVKVKGRSLAGGFAGLRGNRSVVYAQPNHYVSLRSNSLESFSSSGFMRQLGRGIPNDPNTGKLWNLMEPVAGQSGGIGAVSVWNTSVGGKDRKGQDIVVAIIDGGFELNHPDLKNNIWTFKGEIPGNGIDDDGNGFIDDVNGWNAYENNGNIKANDHGTHVAGIVGAIGNNNLGVVGVNWNVKMMPVMGSTDTTAVIMKAYGYVIEQKKLWYQTKGQKGANIVATNSSFGVDNANCKSGEFPAWNSLYEEMGRMGILSAAATANNNVNVDQVGDVPTGCESQYIVTVTNTQQNDTKYAQAGYGARSIDLGAPGTAILSTYIGGQYKQLTGTSMATPHVAGAIGLLYSVANEAFLQKYYTNPGEAALLMKAALLQGVDQIPSLKGITVTGGRLNVGKSAQLLMNFRRVN